MAKTVETGRSIGKVKSPIEPEIRAAIAKAIRAVRRSADASKATLAVGGKKSWAVQK